MGLFDQVVGSVVSNALGGKSGGIVETIMPLINKFPGGLPGLIQAFQNNGLGDIINSWVATGKNLPISGEQITSVLGSDLIGNVAKQLGVAPKEASVNLADVLPGLIDKLTPNGKVPEGNDLLSQGLSALKGSGLFK